MRTRFLKDIKTVLITSGLTSIITSIVLVLKTNKIEMFAWAIVGGMSLVIAGVLGNIIRTYEDY